MCVCTLWGNTHSCMCEGELNFTSSQFALLVKTNKEKTQNQQKKS